MNLFLFTKGALYDAFQSYDVAFVMAGVTTFIGAALMTGVNLLQKVRYHDQLVPPSYDMYQSNTIMSI